ncbi:ATP-binding cassette domain-containing protein [Methylosarcina fibrata]|uniref:ATP-binding cassette domain-containing protein n=1 Tax=Methylosarcina fibrata TaxID=105972 RepID=UPI00036902F1|nr:ABC transporter ATP-binding protein [Methylosarcina fibrata]
MTSLASPLQRLQHLIRIEREDIGTLIAYGIGVGVMSLATPVAVQALVNTIAFGALFQPLLVLTLVLLVLVGFSNMLIALQFYVVEMLQRRLFVRFFDEAAAHLKQAHIASRDHHHLPELANRFLDVAGLQKTASVLLLETLGYVLQTLIGMILLAFYHPLLLAFDLFVIAALWGILFVMGKNGVSTAIEQSKAKYAAQAWLENIAANPLLGKAAGDNAFLGEKTDHLARNYLDACSRHFRILARQNTGALVLHTLANTLLLGMGGWMVINYQLSLGQLIAAELVVSAMIYGLTRLGKTLENFYELLTSVDKIGHLLDIPQESTRGIGFEPTGGSCRLDVYGVFLPESPNTDSLRGIDLHLEPGDRLVLSRGADRGTLLEVLFGLRTPVQGYVRLNHQDLRDLNLGQLRDSVHLVREAEIIEATVLDNLCLGRDLDLGGLRQILAQVGLLEPLDALPDGLHSRLGADGMPLTREQCLRLTLARALAGRPGLLLLDGVLDRIDYRVVPALLDVLLANEAPWTLIVTSRHPEIIARFNRHAFIQQGMLHEQTFENQGKL